MKYIFTLVCSILSGVTTSFCQDFQLSLGGELALTNQKIYGLSQQAGNGIGGSARFEIAGRKTGATLAIGYIDFQDRNNLEMFTSSTTSKMVIPIQVGMKYYVFATRPRNSPYASLELGIMKMKIEKTYSNGSLPGFRRSYHDLSAAPGIGYQLGKLDVCFRLQYNLSDAGYHVYYYNFRLGYNILPTTKKKRL
ncbi:MAG TPA: outer membrane beta-barrel protein [Chitinophagaceae bacterium]|nr:outer membrane beta-barrel protein [Chitinophagaceae bacterium]